MLPLQNVSFFQTNSIPASITKSNPLLRLSASLKPSVAFGALDKSKPTPTFVDTIIARNLLNPAVMTHLPDRVKFPLIHHFFGLIVDTAAQEAASYNDFKATILDIAKVYDKAGNLNDLQAHVHQKGVDPITPYGDHPLFAERIALALYSLPDGSAFTVGREKSNTYQVSKDDKMSRHHVSFSRVNGRAFVEDKDTTNGTYLNGERFVRENREIALPAKPGQHQYDTLQSSADENDDVNVKLGAVYLPLKYSLLTGTRWQKLPDPSDSSGELPVPLPEEPPGT